MADKEKKLTDMRVVSMEVKGVDGDWREVTGRWHDLARLVQRAANQWWEMWLVCHVQNGSAKKIRRWLDEREKIKAKHPDAKECKAALKAFGFCPVECWPEPLRNGYDGSYQTLSREFPGLTKGVLVLLANRLLKTLKARKAASGSLPGWTAILLHNEAMPSFTNPMPIPFDKGNTHTVFIPPAKPGGNYRVELRLSRTEDERGKGHSVVDVAELYCQGRKVAGELAKFKRIVGGEWDFKGSYLVYSRKKRKWFLQVAYEKPQDKRPELDADRVAVLRADIGWPWELELPDGATRHPGGRGNYVAPVRKSLLMQRWNRRANYQHAGQANKGHGRQKIERPQWRLQQEWKNFAKRTNHGFAKQVVEHCIQAGAGTLTYEQPAGEFSGTRFLHNAGKVEGRRDSTGWPWHQLKTFLAEKCEAAGIKLHVVQVSDFEGSGGEETPGRSRVSASGNGGVGSGVGTGKHNRNGTAGGPKKREVSQSSPQSGVAKGG